MQGKLLWGTIFKGLTRKLGFAKELESKATDFYKNSSVKRAKKTKKRKYSL